MSAVGAPSTSALKSEPGEVAAAEKRFLDLLAQRTGGASDLEVQAVLVDISAHVRATIINGLLAKGKVDLFKSGTTLKYKLRNAVADSKMIGAEQEERIVYKVIEDAGCKGIWIRDIRIKSNLPQAILNKTLRTLETRKVIKSVKLVGSTRKKVYMLFELEPDPSLLGGTFYSGQDFDIEFANLLSQQCQKYLELKAETAKQKHVDPMARKHGSYVPSSEVLEHIKQLRISTVELKLSDIESVLNTLVYDSRSERTTGNAGVQLYRSIPALIPSSGVIRIPCGLCPVFNDCQPGKIISPATCEYIKEWLDS